MSEIGDITWNERLEEYFASSGEKAHCLAMMHKQSEAIYSRRRNFIDLPVIIGSAAIGFLNAGSSTMFEDPKISSVALGVGSLFVGVLQTVNTYFNWSKRAEGHRISAIQYSKLYRFLSLEMSLPREERMVPSELLKSVRDTYDRLQEISPILPPEVLDAFRKKYDSNTEISKPEEANGLEKIEVYNFDRTMTENPMRKYKDQYKEIPLKRTESLQSSLSAAFSNMLSRSPPKSPPKSPDKSPDKSPEKLPKAPEKILEKVPEDIVLQIPSAPTGEPKQE